MQWAENHHLPQVRPDALTSTRHCHKLVVRTVRGEKVSGAKITSFLHKEQHMTSMLVTMVRPPTRQLSGQRLSPAANGPALLQSKWTW